MLYFTYGSNMLTSRLNERVKHSQLVGNALLTGHVLAFNKLSIDGTGKANIVEQNGGAVAGVVYKLSKHKMRILDKHEQGYERKLVRIWLNGKKTLAWTYVAKAECTCPHLEIADSYLDLIARGIVQHNLPIWYINEVKRIARVETLAFY